MHYHRGCSVSLPCSEWEGGSTALGSPEGWRLKTLGRRFFKGGKESSFPRGRGWPPIRQASRDPKGSAGSGWKRPSRKKAARERWLAALWPGAFCSFFLSASATALVGRRAGTGRSWGSHFFYKLSKNAKAASLTSTYRGFSVSAQLSKSLRFLKVIPLNPSPPQFPPKRGKNPGAGKKE